MHVINSSSRLRTRTNIDRLENGVLVKDVRKDNESLLFITLMMWSKDGVRSNEERRRRGEKVVCRLSTWRRFSRAEANGAFLDHACSGAGQRIGGDGAICGLGLCLEDSPPSSMHLFLWELLLSSLNFFPLLPFHQSDLDFRWTRACSL